MESIYRKVAVVMPIRNEEASVEPTMDAIFASTRLPDEIIIADGMSTDGSVAAIKSYYNRGIPIRVVSNPTIWSGGGRNAAIRVADSEIIVLSDFGNTVEPNYIEEIVRPFDDDSVDIVGGLFKMRATNDFEHCVASIHYFEDYTLDRYSREEIRQMIPPVVFPGGLCTAFRRRIWVAAGEQPEWLAKGQDKMFSRKVHAIGGRGLVAVDARLWHHVRGTPQELFRQLYFYGRGNGQMRFLSKHVVLLMEVYGALAFLLMLGWFLPVSFFLAAFFLGAYIWRAGIRKVIQVDGSLRKIRYIPIATAVLLIRDIGSLLGHFVGWMEWVFVPRYRTNYQHYMSGLLQDRIPLVAPQTCHQSIFGRLRRAFGVV